MILTLAVNKWKLCLHNVSKELMATEKVLPMPQKNISSKWAFEEKFMQKVPKMQALQTMKQILCKIRKSWKP